MKVRLIEPFELTMESYNDFVSEWKIANEKIVPYAARPRGMDFEELIIDWDTSKAKVAYDKGFVPSSLFFLKNESERVLGAIHIRHKLNDSLKQIGGHIGFGVRPTERGKGYASEMLRLGLEKAKVLGLQEVLLTCDDDNRPSFRTIELNGGKLREVAEVNQVLIRRYTISIGRSLVF